MKRTVLALLLGTGIGSICVSAHASQDQFQVSNLTASGGILSIPYDPTDYPIASDITFNSIVLTENYADSTIVTDTLYDSTNTAQTSLGSILSGNNILTGLTFNAEAHGGLTSATLTGETGPLTADVYTSAGIGGTTGTTDILPTFSATFTGAKTGDFVNIYLYGDNPGRPATPYAAGTLSLMATDVPEPGMIALLAASGCAGLIGLRRRHA